VAVSYFSRGGLTNVDAVDSSKAYTIPDPVWPVAPIIVTFIFDERSD
jgi:hypothetical protein